MINIIKKEIDVKEHLRKNLEIICDFCTTITIKNAKKVNLYSIMVMVVLK